MSAFAMRLLLTLFLILAVGFSGLEARAQSPDSGIYQITDVPVDVTADSSVHARDQAVKQGQRLAFQQLADRLGADASLASKISDDDIGALVQSFEVQNERASPVRYLGMITVQFRPSAVKSFLGSKKAFFTDTRSRPVLVLPVSTADGHAVLWEEITKWRSAWDAAAHSAGLVPVVLPQGGLDDIAVLSTDEAMAGKPEALAALMTKYQTGSALVVVMNGDVTKPGSTVTVEMRRYDATGASLSNASLILSAPTDKKDVDALYPEAVKQARTQLEAEWKQELRSQQAVASGPTGADPAEGGNYTPSGNMAALSRLPVDVPIATLAEWEKIRQQLDHVPNIKHAEIITLARGLTNIELDFTGDVPQLQTALSEQHLYLTQNRTTGLWVLQPMTHTGAN